MVPLAAVLIREQHQVAVRADAGTPAGVGEQQQREQAGHLRLARQQNGERPGEPDRLVAEVFPDQGLAAGGQVSLGEDQVHHSQHRGLRRAGRSSRPGTRNAIPAWRILRLARTRRCAMVGSGTRNEAAICAVVSPHTARSVSATLAAGSSAG